MSSVLYRISSGEAESYSNNDNPYGDINTQYFAVAINPPSPDGLDLSVPKIYDGVELRNATQAEIDGFQAFVDTDNALLARDDAKIMLAYAGVGMPVLQRAIGLVTMDEINIVRVALGLSMRTKEEVAVMVYQKIDSGLSD